MITSIDLSGWSELDAAWRKAPDIVREELTAAVMESEMLLEREVKDLTPTTHGILRASFAAHSPVILADSVIGVMGTSVDYAVPVELGTKPHWAPIEPLVDWVQHKLGYTGEKAEKVARAVQFGIAHHGTPAHGMVHRGFNRSRAQVAMFFHRALLRIGDRLAGA